MPKGRLERYSFPPPTECLDQALVKFLATRQLRIRGLEDQREKRRSSSKRQLLRANNLGVISAQNKKKKEETPSLRVFQWNTSPPGAQSSCSEATREGLPAVRVPGGWGYFPGNSAQCGANMLCISKTMAENWGIRSMKSRRQTWSSVSVILIGCDPQFGVFFNFTMAI